MMWGYDFGWGWFMMSLGMVFWIALLVVLVWATIRWLDRRSNGVGPQGSAVPTGGPSALEILRQRYARGEIDTATFEQMRECLETSAAHEAQSRMR
jgi:putative membrane protein